MKYLDLQLYNVPRPDADQVRLQHKMALYFKDDLPEGISNKQGQPFVGLPGVKDSGARVLEVDFQSGHKRYLTKWGTTSEELQQLHAEHSARCSRGYQDREDKELLEKYSECFEELLAAKEQLVKAKVGKSVAYQNVLVADDKLKDHLKKNLDESQKPDLPEVDGISDAILQALPNNISSEDALKLFYWVTDTIKARDLELGIAASKQATKTADQQAEADDLLLRAAVKRFDWAKGLQERRLQERAEGFKSAAEMVRWTDPPSEMQTIPQELRKREQAMNIELARAISALISCYADPKAVFNAFDADGSGYLTQAEFYNFDAALQQHEGGKLLRELPRAPSRSDYDGLHTALDESIPPVDGKVDKNELLSGLKIVAAGGTNPLQGMALKREAPNPLAGLAKKNK